MSSFQLETVQLDLPALAGAFGRRLHEAGVPVTAERSANFAAALSLVRPVSRRRLYWTARAVFVSDPSQVRPFDSVFRAVFGAGEISSAEIAADAETIPSMPDERDQARPPTDAPRRLREDALTGASAPGEAGTSERSEDERTIEVPTLSSAEEILRHQRFDALSADELAELYRLMSRLQVATPVRRTRRARRDAHGERIDMRRTLRASLRTAGDPIRLARRRRRVLRRRMVLLCDISGSMEPYARAYLQFLTCAAGGVSGGPSASRAEAFAFATRLTRLTRALQSRNPELAIQRAAAAAPDWASGTRIGDALKTFNDRYGRRGMARGAVVVILSDGWERGDPELVGREMQRLARVAYRIVWVNPRAAAREFAPRVGGMAAALPHCDALVSGHTLAALDEVIDAIGADRERDRDPSAPWAPPAPPPEPDQAQEDEQWGSATPVPGSSVAMPSGYSPSRGRTTPGWSGPRPFGPVHEIDPEPLGPVHDTEQR
jgi:uncharacterized protein with von Willebrand factor type A (vWA) domain